MSHRTSLHRHDNRWAGSPEWYTPAWLLDRVRAFYGGDFFDPCPASGGVVKDNGLLLSWRGKRVWCNPPYGKPIERWVVKAMTEPVREIILLVPAYVETRWFAPFYSHTMLFFRGRVVFDRPGQVGKGRRIDSAPHPSVLVYRGRRHRQFAEAFCDLGPVMRTYMPMRAKQPTLLDAPPEPTMDLTVVGGAA